MWSFETQIQSARRRFQGKLFREKIFSLGIWWLAGYLFLRSFFLLTPSFFWIEKIFVALFFLLVVYISWQLSSLSLLKTAYFLDEKLSSQDLISTAVFVLHHLPTPESSFEEEILKRASEKLKHSSDLFSFSLPSSLRYSLPLLIASLSFWLARPSSPPEKRPPEVHFFSFEISHSTEEGKIPSPKEGLAKTSSPDLSLSSSKAEEKKVSEKLMERLEEEMKKSRLRQEILKSPQLKELARILEQKEEEKNSSLEKFLMDKNIQKEWKEKLEPLLSGKKISSPSEKKAFLEDLWKEKNLSLSVLQSWKKEMENQIVSPSATGGASSALQPATNTQYLEKEKMTLASSPIFWKELEERKISPLHWPSIQKYFQMLKAQQ